jgi:hypothetical protein
MEIKKVDVTSKGPQQLLWVSLGLAAKLEKSRMNIAENQRVFGYHFSAAWQ